LRATPDFTGRSGGEGIPEIVFGPSGVVVAQLSFPNLSASAQSGVVLNGRL
jgi:hypothetical protein